MKKYLLAAFTVSLFALPLSASIRPTPGQFGLKGEWIYFCPGIEDTYFTAPVELAEGFPQLTDKINNLMPYESGYRLEGVYSFCNCINDLRLRWTHLVQASHSTFIPGELPVTGNVPTEIPHAATFTAFATASSKITMEYYTAEALLGQILYNCSPFTLEVEAGIQYAHIKFNEDVFYSLAPIGNALNTSLLFEDQFSGIGPEVAFDADYALYNNDCCCPGTLYLTSTLRGALLIGDSRAKFSDIAVTTEERTPLSFYNIDDKKSWRVIPWGDIKLGFNYTSCFDCFTLSIEAGYEAGCYIKAISKERFTDQIAPGYSFNQFQDFTYHGPYVAAEVMF